MHVNPGGRAKDACMRAMKRFLRGFGFRDFSPCLLYTSRGNTCSRAPGCTALKLWTMVDDAVNGVIDKVTLADMVQWEREKENET